MRSPAFSSDFCALGFDLLNGCIGQVPHHLPADRRVRIEQPLYNRVLWLSGSPFGWIGCHLSVSPYSGQKALFLMRTQITFARLQMRSRTPCQLHSFLSTVLEPDPPHKVHARLL